MAVRGNILFLALGMMLASGSAKALDQVTFGTNWVAEAEHGGYYQALATGIYEKYDLDVTIRPGGPQVNHRQLLLAGKIDFNMAGNMFAAFNSAATTFPSSSICSSAKPQRSTERRSAICRKVPSGR
jgi:NitT/TauT family transport system substrate-binding protein